eukprot:scaffold3031_cov285-Pinguiococcus_pyrenoidosus.AAC.5
MRGKPSTSVVTDGDHLELKTLRRLLSTFSVTARLAPKSFSSAALLTWVLPAENRGRSDFKEVMALRENIRRQAVALQLQQLQQRREELNEVLVWLSSDGQSFTSPVDGNTLLYVHAPGFQEVSKSVARQRLLQEMHEVEEEIKRVCATLGVTDG